MRIVESKKAGPSFVAICPHCEHDLHEIIRIEDEAKGLFEGRKGYCYACPHCHKVLGFADYSS